MKVCPAHVTFNPKTWIVFCCCRLSSGSGSSTRPSSSHVNNKDINLLTGSQSQVQNSLLNFANVHYYCSDKLLCFLNLMVAPKLPKQDFPFSSIYIHLLKDDVFFVDSYHSNQYQYRTVNVLADKLRLSRTPLKCFFFVDVSANADDQF